MTRERRLELKREDQRRRREQAEADGLCPVCCKRRPRAGHKHCDDCNEYARDHRVITGRIWNNSQHVSRADRFHVCCQAHGKHRAECREAA